MRLFGQKNASRQEYKHPLISSMCTALVGRHTKIAIYTFPEHLTFKGPAKSNPLCKNGWDGVIRSSGTSAICCVVDFKEKRQHLIQFLIKFLIIVLTPMIEICWLQESYYHRHECCFIEISKA